MALLFFRDDEILYLNCSYAWHSCQAFFCASPARLPRGDQTVTSQLGECQHGCQDLQVVGDRVVEGSRDKPSAYLGYRPAQEGFWLSKMKNF